MIDTKNSHKDPGLNTIVLCPACLKPSLKFVREYTSGWATPPKRYCPLCHYNGILVFEMDRDEYFNIPEDQREIILAKYRDESFVADEYDEEEEKNLKKDTTD
ncbi:MAG: hypothetical protein ACFFD1_02790 [Candidatus Thorarchaeota archaeon]